MIRSTNHLAARRRARVAAAAAVALTLVAGTASSALAHGKPQPPAPAVVTRAAVDPVLVEGRGATVPFLEQEAENAVTTGVTTGTVIGPGRDAYTIEAEASGRSAVRLAAGQHVEFTLPADANAITVRYSIPDSPTGGGITSPLDVSVLRQGKKVGVDRRMTLTSAYSYLYNQYPFTNDPMADLLQPGWGSPSARASPRRRRRPRGSRSRSAP
ncbi:hypothetical protein [Cellulosimicrobium cellulans]|uniref:hypothetical protein n=1 Tax=Cellulosimicrobium cellulans TaxID=1710 RepID=UPI0024068E21|nr:hypothetical protein [Cellulosimicrobium cellulans]